MFVYMLLLPPLFLGPYDIKYAYLDTQTEKRIEYAFLF